MRTALIAAILILNGCAGKAQSNVNTSGLQPTVVIPLDIDPDTILVEVSIPPPPQPLVEGDVATDAEYAQAAKRVRNVSSIPKTHLWWGFRPEITANYPLMVEVIRLSGSAGFHMWHTAEDTERIMSACDEVKLTSNKTSAIALNYSPWRKLDRGTDPTTLTKQQQTDELQQLYEYLGRMKTRIEGRRNAFPVTHVLFDAEMLMPGITPEGSDAEKHRKLITELYDTQYSLAKRFFPKAKVVWYAWSYRKEYGHKTPQPYPNHTLTGRNDNNWSPIMYTPQHQDKLLDILNIQPDDGREVIPWITIGGGYRVKTNVRQEFVHTLDYPWEVAYNLGLLINHPWISQRQERIDYYGNWPRITEVCVYPGPFQHPGFAEKFGAYVAGSNNSSEDEALQLVEALRVMEANPRDKPIEEPTDPSTLKTQSFSVLFKDGGHLDIAFDGTDLPLRHFPANIANTGSGEAWDYPEHIVVEPLAAEEKQVTFVYGENKRSVMRVKEHASWLEFELTEVQGECGEIRTFGPVFEVTQTKKHFLRSFCDLNNGLVAGCLPMNPETHTANYTDANRPNHMVYARTKAIPSPKAVTHRFGFFICRQKELASVVQNIEDAADYPRSNRAAPENDKDYIFLLTTDGATSQDIINMCRSTGVDSVLLGNRIWHDWCDTGKPYAIEASGKALIEDLQAAGIYVGCHAFAHKVCASGYYATQSAHIHPYSKGHRKNFTWNNILPETAASAFAQTIQELGVSWLYFDGAEMLWSGSRGENSKYDWYLTGRMTEDIMKELDALGIDIKVHQQSNHGGNGYHYITRTGQTDYWEDPSGHMNAPQYRSPTDSIDIRAEQFAELKSRNMTPDLGWFGRVHVATGNNPLTYEDRYATMKEWQYLCQKSIEHDAPIGIRTTYDYWMNDPLRSKLEDLIKSTIKQRRSQIRQMEAAKSGGTISRSKPPQTQ